MPPKTIRSIEELEDLLSEPTDQLVDAMRDLPGDILILGVGGKMGPTLARLAMRATVAAGKPRRIIGVARFSNPELPDRLGSHGIECVRADLTDREAVASLPDAPNVVWMGGMKFGTSSQASLTWAMNTYAPALVCERYRASRIVAFSSGNVYGLTPVAGGGSVETDPPNPVGEYAMSALGRERIFEYFSHRYGTPMAILRLNYAVELRYGVLVDIARKVWSGDAIDVTMGHFNVIWQRDANAQALLAFHQLASPPRILNITGPEILSTRSVAEEFARLFGKPARLSGKEAEDALLNNAAESHRLWGRPAVSINGVIAWIADWVRQGSESLNKPTHFESRAGDF